MANRSAPFPNLLPHDSSHGSHAAPSHGSHSHGSHAHGSHHGSPSHGAHCSHDHSSHDHSSHDHSSHDHSSHDHSSHDHSSHDHSSQDHGSHDHCSHDHGHAHDHAISLPDFKRTSESLSRSLAHYISLIWGEPHSKTVFIYMILKGSFMTLQFLYGVIYGRIACVSASFHTGFDCLAMTASLAALVLLGRPADKTYSFGYDRFAVLAAFTQALFLIFVAMFLVMESFHKLYQPPELHSEILSFATIGLCLDLIGIFLFRRFHSTKTLQTLVEAGDRDYSTLFMNMHGVFLHAGADMLVHSGLLLATWLQTTQDVMVANGLVFMLVSLTIIKHCSPLLISTGLILLQCTPAGLQQPLNRAIREISFYDGVLECRSVHWWGAAPGQTVGTLHVRVRNDANEQAVLKDVRKLLEPHVKSLSVQVEKDHPVGWMVSYA